MQRHARSDQGHAVLRALAQHLRAADLESLVGPIQGRIRAPRGAHVDDAVESGHQPGQLRGLVGVARVKHG